MSWRAVVVGREGSPCVSPDIGVGSEWQLVGSTVEDAFDGAIAGLSVVEGPAGGGLQARF